MGTNLNQVFILNTANLETGSTYTSPTAGDVGIWKLDGTPGYVSTKLFETQFVIADTDDDDGATTAVTTPSVFANPAWLYNNLQIVQGNSGNPIASPIINTSNIKRITFDPFVATVANKIVITPNATFTGVSSVDIKIIIKALPTDQLSFYDGDNSGYTILSGSDAIPMGVFNATNHKAISFSFDCSSTATFCSAGKAAGDAHDLLNKMFTFTDTGTGTSLDIESKHVGLIFEVVVLDQDGNNIVGSGSNTVALTTTGYKAGVGNDWQVLGDELRTRSRVGNFNRMYLPQNPATLTKPEYQYHKITIEYAHNWPMSTGIAPAGALNQAVIYAADSSTALAAGDTNIDAVLNMSNVNAQVKYIW